jgi:Ca-activated chloride channel homolog
MKNSIVLWVLLAAVRTALLAQTPAVTFKSEARLVEVYATVLDQKGRYLDGIPRNSFQITDNGTPQKVEVFENTAAELSCAIVLDTTGSMTRAFPTVRNAIIHLIDELRDNDWLAIYGFNTSLELLHDFSTDRVAAKQALLRTRAGGGTALFDAISRVAGDVSKRSGKKAVIVFTDGDDNASVLNIQNVVQRAKKTGVPIYMVAEGEAMKTPALFQRLKEIAELTGAKAYAAKTVNVVPAVFRDISQELQHTYLLAYHPPESVDENWRKIQLSVTGFKDYKIRAKEGYFPF